MSSKRVSSKQHRRAPANAESLLPIFAAVKQNDPISLATILKDTPDAVNFVDGTEYKSTPLHVAARRGMVAVAKALLTAGAQVNAVDTSLKTPLHWACSAEHVEMVQLLLLQPKISLDLADSKKRFPLHLAVALAPTETVKLLIEHEHSEDTINAKDVHGSTPLHVAVRYSREEAEVLLLAHNGILVDTPDRRGRTPLHYACQLGKENSVRRLVEAKASVNCADSAGDTPLHYACHANCSAAVHILVKAGADVNAENERTYTPMHIAVEMEFDSICHILTQSGADIGIRYDMQFYTKRHQKHVQQIRLSALDESGGDHDTKPVSPDQREMASSSSVEPANPELASLSLKSDRYGYIIKGDNDPVADTADAKSQKTVAKLTAERTKKWLKMLRKWQTFSKKNKEKVSRRVWKGIPDAVRGQAWRCFLSTNISKQQNPQLYGDLLKKKAPQKVIHQIDVDINRSARDHLQFYERFGPGQISLFNILKAYSIHDPTVSYCQSMSDVTAFVLMQIEEEEAFWFLVELLQSPRFKMNKRYEDGFPGLKESFFVHSQLLKKYLPRLASQFEKDGLDPAFYTMNWFMKIFIDILPTEVLVRLWDVMLYLGFDIVYSFIIVLMGYYQEKLLGKSMDECMMTLHRIRSLPPSVTIDRFFEDVQKLGIKPSFIRELEAQYQHLAATKTTPSPRIEPRDQASRRKEVLKIADAPAALQNNSSADLKASTHQHDVSVSDSESAASNDFGMATFNPLNMELPPPVDPQPSPVTNKRKSTSVEDFVGSNGSAQVESHDNEAEPSRSEKRKSRVHHAETNDPTDSSRKHNRKSQTVEKMDVVSSHSQKAHKRKSRIVERGNDQQD